MFRRNKKKSKKPNLLEMSEAERVQLIKDVKKKLQQKNIEAKLWHLLLEAESITVNGNIVWGENQQLSGFYLRI